MLFNKFVRNYREKMSPGKVLKVRTWTRSFKDIASVFDFNSVGRVTD